MDLDVGCFRARLSSVGAVGVRMTMRERNLAILRRFGQGAAHFEPVADSTPFMNSPDILDNMTLRILDQTPKGLYTFFPFEPIGELSGPCLRGRVKITHPCKYNQWNARR